MSYISIIQCEWENKGLCQGAKNEKNICDNHVSIDRVLVGFSHTNSLISYALLLWVVLIFIFFLNNCL